jgi:hypothetical protein
LRLSPDFILTDEPFSLSSVEVDIIWAFAGLSSSPSPPLPRARITWDPDKSP